MKRSPLQMCAGVALAFLAPTIGSFAQGTSSPAVQPGLLQSSLAAPVAQAFSGQRTVSGVQLAGSATWFAGGDPDEGTARLNLAADGSWRVELSLSTLGQRTESQAGSGVNAECSWAGADGKTHTIDQGNCWRPVVWFLPAFSLQAAQATAALTLADHGMTPVGAEGAIYRHVQASLQLAELPKEMQADIAKQSTTHIGIDPATSLPAVLAYTLKADKGTASPIKVEVRYSNYRQIEGVQIPFTIERYLNGVLQLRISVTSAQVN